MICYVCRAQAAGICTSCGAALCEIHFRESRTYSVGGTRFGCPHPVTAQKTTARPRETDALPTLRRRVV